MIVSNPNGEEALKITPEGLTIINQLALIDQQTGNKWILKISNGKLLIEPLHIEDKRNQKLKKILK